MMFCSELNNKICLTLKNNLHICTKKKYTQTQLEQNAMNSKWMNDVKELYI